MLKEIKAQSARSLFFYQLQCKKMTVGCFVFMEILKQRGDKPM